MEQHIIDKLESLKTLLDSGVLSKDEFEVKKNELLSGVGEMQSPKKPKNILVVTILAILAVLTIGGYLYSRNSKATQTSILYKESVYGITIGKNYNTVLKKAKNDADSKKRVMGLVIAENKSEIGLSHKDYRGVVFDGVIYHFSSGVVSAIELRKTANQYDGDAAQIIQEAYNNVEASLRKEKYSYQETDEGMVFSNEYEKIIIHQESDYSDQYELNVKIEKR